MRGRLNLWAVFHRRYPGEKLKALFFDRNNAVKWANAHKKVQEAEGEYEHTWDVEMLVTKDEIELKSVTLK